MSTPQFEQLQAKAEDGQPESQFLLSQICLQNRDLDGMVHWLLAASAKQHSDALDALGHCYEKGMGVAKDYALALEHYERAVRGGSALAAYHEAELLHKSRDGADNETRIKALLQSAADAELVAALRVIAYLAMQQASQKDLAVYCLRRAAGAGDPVSSFNLGWWLLQDSEDVKQEAVYWLQRAASAQYPIVETLLAPLHGVSAEAPPQISKETIALDDSLSLYPESQSADREDLNADPAVALFKNVLDIVDCAYLIFLSRPHLKRADVIDPDSQGEGMISDVRTSMHTYLPFDLVDIIGRCIELKIIGEIGENLESSEPMSILRYAPGQYYRPHVDYFNPKLDVAEKLLQDGGQRRASAVTYLSAPSAGGGTSFPRLKLSVPAIAGSTLWFRNCFDDGQVDDRSLHAGETVEKGEKWVVTKWFRERPTRYLEF
ncbi:MAG: 2OG-Fe(II) oxygenase [Gammaproteobacteria bacterium]|nr:2OG-Fe(II) oxygenase [Gammaproteobacteria bacterium]